MIISIDHTTIKVDLIVYYYCEKRSHFHSKHHHEKGNFKLKIIRIIAIKLSYNGINPYPTNYNRCIRAKKTVRKKKKYIDIFKKPL